MDRSTHTALPDITRQHPQAAIGTQQGRQRNSNISIISHENNHKRFVLVLYSISDAQYLNEYRSEGPLSDVFSPWARWEGGLVGIESSSGGTVGGVSWPNKI